MMKTLALLAILHLATLPQGSKSAKSPGCGEDPVSYNDGAWKMKKLQFQDQFAVQGEIKRRYQVRLPKSKRLWPWVLWVPQLSLVLLCLNLSF